MHARHGSGAEMPAWATRFFLAQEELLPGALHASTNKSPQTVSGCGQIPSLPWDYDFSLFLKAKNYEQNIRPSSGVYLFAHALMHSARTMERTRDTRERTVPTGTFKCAAASS
jgi:hypothetical protein